MDMKRTMEHEEIKAMMKAFIDANPYLTPWEKANKKREIDQAGCVADVICASVHQLIDMINTTY